MDRNYKTTEQEVIVKNIFDEEDQKMIDHLLHKMLGLEDSIKLDANLQETPHRWCKYWTEMTEGYRINPKSYLDKNFPVDTPNMADDPETFDSEHTESLYRNGIVMVSCDARSNCCHHLVTMHGRVYVAYIPGEKVVGLSKVVRMIRGYGRRLNLQEGWMNNIADAMMEKLEPRGVLVYSTMVHECVASRGVEEQSSATTSTVVRGVFTDSLAKNEALSMINSAEIRRN